MYYANEALKYEPPRPDLRLNLKLEQFGTAYWWSLSLYFFSITFSFYVSLIGVDRSEIM